MPLDDATIPARSVTSRDVARMAGVSQSAVSLVLNGGAIRHGLSAATQARVRDAAESLGYTPNHAARSLRRQRSNTITFVTADLGNRYFAELVAAAGPVAHANGYMVNVVAARCDADEQRLVAHLATGVSDGIVVHGGSSRIVAAIDGLQRRGVACVLVQAPGDPGRVPCIQVDLAGGGRLATRHLLALGHRVIAHVTDARLLGQPVNHRLQGYQGALDQAGIGADPDLVVAADNSFAGGAAAVRSLLQRPVRPTAIFMFNDQMAIGALHALDAMGVRVPQDIALVGFDGTDLGAYSKPALTTIDHPRAELGRRAVAAVLRQLDGDPAPADTAALPVRLVVRQSCGGELD